jgi:dTDP-glucose 4,6-dehydratase
MFRLPDIDLNHVLKLAHADLQALKHKKLFITGGTGFIGSWMVDCLLHADRVLNLDLKIYMLCRDSQKMYARFPHFREESQIQIVKGDVRHFVMEERGRVDFVIHGATDASAKLNKEDPLLMSDTIVQGTRNVLENARKLGVDRFLMLSSGGVYGKFMNGVTHVTENYPGGPDPLNLWYTYSESKRMAELLCAIYADRYHVEVPIARIFALLGPRLPLDAHFAAGNFIQDALLGRPVRVAGDGTSIRSYLYSVDLIVWLLAILVRGSSGCAYNVGSAEAISIKDLATFISQLPCPAVPVEILGVQDASNPVGYYVPNVNRACEDLGLQVWTSLREAATRTFEWYRRSEGV